MLVKETDIKLRYSVSEHLFYLYGDGRYAERCYIVDTLDDSIHSEDLSIDEGLCSLRELSANFPRRFVLVFDDLTDNDNIKFRPTSHSSDVPF